MRVKIFNGRNHKEIEQSINQWLETENPQIINVLQSEGGSNNEGNIYRNVTITIFFREAADSPVIS